MRPITRRSDLISSQTLVWCMLKGTPTCCKPRRPLSLSDPKDESQKRLSAIVAKILRDRRNGL